MIEVSLGQDFAVDEFLLEKNFNLNFTAFKRFYYSFARPFLPLFVRHYLQSRYTKKIKYNENFIFNDLIEIIKKDEKQWQEFLQKLYPNNERSAVVLTHDVESQKGYDYIPKVIELESKYGFKSSWNIVPYKYHITEDVLHEIRSHGHEIGIHGYNHDGKLFYSLKVFQSRVPYINAALEKYGAVGFRSPQVHRNLEWLQMLQIDYDASCFDYDPFQPFPGGTGSVWPFRAGKFIELPYTLPQDHVLFYTLKLKSSEVWINKVKWLMKNHGVITALTHPDYLCEKDHLKYYEELLSFLRELENVWYCLPREITSFWNSKFC